MKSWSQQDLHAAKEFQEKARHWNLPLVMADVLVMTLVDEKLKVLLVKRGAPPEQGKWSLPGALVNPELDVNLEATALRALEGKTATETPYLEQLEHFSGADRDPRGWSISYAYVCLLPADQLHLKPGAGVEQVKLFDVEDACGMTLAFDHEQMLAKGLERVRNKVNYSSLPAHLLPERFTLTELEHTYEAILQQDLDKSAFRKKVAEAGFVRPVAGAFKTGAFRPAQLYEIDKDKPLALFRSNLTA